MYKCLIKNRISDKLYSRNKAHDNGFTLVELVVVLALIAILLSITIFSGLAWQDYARFNHEESAAEDIFFAAQNQLTEYDASGAMKNKVKEVLQGTSPSGYDGVYVLATADDHGKLPDILHDAGSSQAYYSWTSIWEAMVNSNTMSRQKATILTLKAKKGDYDIYLASKADPTYTGDTISVGTELLFDMVAPYVSDTSVLNGSIVLEFSPEAGQVFSVCYSDVASDFDYSDSNSGTVIGINDRRLQVRKENMVGYYSVERLYEKLEKTDDGETDLSLMIKSDNILELVVWGKTPTSLKTNDKLTFVIYDGANATDTPVMTFSIDYNPSLKDPVTDKTHSLSATDYKDGLANAMADPVYIAEVEMSAGKFSGLKKTYRFPVWIDSNNKMHIVLDAADVQAQSYAYNNAFIKGTPSDLDVEKFLNTYSFYRFGLSSEESQVHYIYGSVSQNGLQPVYSKREIEPTGDYPDGLIEHTDPLAINDNNTVGECTTFKSYTASAEDSNNKTIEIANGRHLYNVRYETDYKKSGSTVKNTFKLVSDIDWYQFVGKKDELGAASSSAPNYFLNSYDITVNPHAKAGIDYSGNNIATGGTGVANTTYTDTADYPFPGFRCLDKNDVFTQDYSEADTFAADGSSNGLKSYHINNLRISIAANIIYGVYDSVFFDPSIAGTGANDYSDAKNQALDSGNFTGTNTIARKGQLPLGLFAENLGTISNITLDKHVVEGMQVLGDNKNIVYTCMSGGFTGNNMGTVSGLTILDSAADNDPINRKTHINGRTDVGGIIGRQSFSVNEADEVTIAGLSNEGTVTGYENVGGIVGRAYVHYVGDDTANGAPSPDSYGTVRQDYYKDGYVVSETGKSLALDNVYRAKSISIEDCINKGHVTGDPLIYDKTTHNKLDGVDVSSDSFIHCAFIGGIAGLTMDGFPVDDDINALKNYMSNGFYSGTHTLIKVSNCKSEVFYTKSEIEDMRDTNFAGINNMKDCYVGGLIGYARLTYIIDCGNGDDDETDFTSEDEIPLVMGRNYVGGLIGCSDESGFFSDEGRTYNSVNNNLVIGYRFVGGVAGGFGVGGANKNTFSFKNPAQNDASQPSVKFSDNSVDPNQSNRKHLVTKLCNKGIVLGLRNDKDLNAIFEKSSDTQAGIRNANAESGMIGGIAGASHTPLDGCDNIQSDNTKKYNLSLVGFTDADISGFDNLTTEYITGVVNKSAFGGSGVGGIEGCVLKYGYINRLAFKIGNTTKKPISNINAIVFGQDYVGGGVGMISDEGYTNAYNFYPSTKDNPSKVLDGMVVIGRDSVGGIAGVIRAKFNYDKDNRDTTAISSPFAVYGRYGVGCVTGTIYTASDAIIGSGIAINLKMTGTDRVSINGIAYVGGIAGVDLDAKPYVAPFNGSVVFSGVDINGKYFVGGYFGAFDNSKGSLDWTNVRTPQSNNTVNAEIFGGGIIGLYSVGISGRKPFNSLDSTGDADGTLFKLAESLWDSENKQYLDAEDAFDLIVNGDIKNGDVFLTNTTNSYTFDKVLENTTPVTTKLFAGGFMGYIPEGQKLTIKNFTNSSRLEAKGYVGGDSGTSVYESTDSSDKYAYLGTVVGRLPKGSRIDTCINNVASTDYVAREASYLGGLTEVNAGVIQNCVNDSTLTYGSGGVGAFAGMNGTKVTSIAYTGSDETISINTNNSTGLIYNCKNNGNITSTAGFAGGMTAADGGSDTPAARVSAIYQCINIGTITGNEAAGMVARPSSNDIIKFCRNYGTISGTVKRYGIAGGVVGNINKNLEASGISIQEGITEDPIAPMSSGSLKRNFYIYDSVDAADLEVNDNVGVDVYYSSSLQNVLNSVPAGAVPADDTELAANFKTVEAGYDNTITVESPATGLDIDYFRIYWLQRSDEDIQYTYSVAFTYLDNSTEAKTVTYNRIINDMTDGTGDVLLYDDIPVLGYNNKKIRPVSIRITTSDDAGTYYYSAMTTIKYIVDGTGTVTGSVERPIVDNANKYNSVDYSTGVIDNSAYIFDYHAAVHGDGETIEYPPLSDRWSKQLYVFKTHEGKYNLIYKRNDEYMAGDSDLLMATSLDSDFSLAGAAQKCQYLDTWFVGTNGNGFVDDYTGHPNSAFVD